MRNLIKDINSIFQNTSKFHCGLQLDWFHRGSWVQPEIFLRHNNSNTEWDPFFGTQSLPKSHPSGSTYWCKKSKDKLLGRCTGNGGINCKSQLAELFLSNRPSWWTTLQIFLFFHIPGLTCTSRTTHHRNLMAPPPKSPPRKYKAVLRENTPPWKRTWQCKHRHLKMYLLWRMVICHCHISFRGVLGKLLPQIDPFPRSKRSTLWAVASSPGVNLQCVHFV